MSQPSDSIDLREIGAALRRGALWIAGGAILGLGAGAATLAFLTPEYEASATVLLRSQVGGSASALALSRLSGLLGGVPGGSGGSAVETEEKILTSRAVLGEVVDSLGLQARIVEPRGARADSFFTRVRLDPGVEGGVYRFERRGSGYAVEGKGASGVATPGVPYRIPGGVLVLRRGRLPESFAVEVSDRQGAIAHVANSVASEVVGGEIVEVSYRAENPRLAAAVPNAMIARYLQRRRTTDRGVNQHRYEFLTRHADSISIQLAAAEGALRSHQEQSGILDPELSGRTDLERAMSIQGELETSEVEARALRGIIDKGSSGRLSPRELAAYPTFLRNPAINNVLSRLLELETERIGLLEKRTERDPDVVALTSSIEHLESRLVSLSRDYLGGLERQGTELRRELGTYRAELSALPRQAEESLRREREVKRLSETLVALQTQLVEARLGAISEGGDVRQIDVAVPPRSAAFPNPVLNLLGGLLGGLFFGMIAAVGVARVRQDVREPWEAELATGRPAVALNPRHPLWLSGLGRARTALLLPAGKWVDAREVGERLVATAALQGREGVVADLAQAGVGTPPSRLVSVGTPAKLIAAGDGEPVDFVASDEGAPAYAALSNGSSAAGPRSVLGDLEERFPFVVAALPGVESAQTVAVLAADRPVVVVARSGKVTRSELRDTIEICEQMGVPVAGIVLQPAGKGGRLA